MVKIVRDSHSASPYPQNVWFWNVGDTENKCQEGGAQEILDHLNTIEPGVTDTNRTCLEPLSERWKCVAYNIPCTCQNTVYVGETWRLFQTRKKEHMEERQTDK